jgi:hypothetical protein
MEVALAVVPPREVRVVGVQRTGGVGSPPAAMIAATGERSSGCTCVESVNATGS